MRSGRNLTFPGKEGIRKTVNEMAKIQQENTASMEIMPEEERGDVSEYGPVPLY